FVRSESRRQGQATLNRSLGLGQDVEERFYGFIVLRYFGVNKSSCQRVVQAAHARRGRVLQRPRA
ncbi:hypothetical protein G9C98_001363, partial [Cotesia typhae]